MKYLLCEAHGIGDCILILPIAKAIKKYDKSAYIKVFTKSDKNKIKINKSIMSLQHYVDEIEYYSKNEILHSIWFLFKNIIKHYDYGIVIQDYDNKSTSSIPSIIVNLCCKKTSGTLIKSNKKIKYDYYVERKHGARRDELFFDAAQKIGIDVKKEKFNYLLNSNLVMSNLPTFVFQKKQPIIVLVVGTAPVSLKINNTLTFNDTKQWPYDYWFSLADKLTNSGFNIFLLGGKKEKEEICRLNLAINNDSIINATGCYSIKQSIAIINMADLIVGADTGLMHCAGALGKKSLTLFGCTDPKEYLPFGNNSNYIASNMECSPCFGTLKSVNCSDIACMRTITVNMVFDRIKKILNT